MADTTNFAWAKPTVGGSVGAWGTVLNALFDDQDTDLNTVKTTADAALPRAGGTLTGRLYVKTDKYVVHNLGASVSGAKAIDLSTGQYHYGTISGDTTFSFSNVPATGAAIFLILELTNGGAHTITWPASVKWPHGSVPALTVSGVDVLTLFTRDGGTTWYAAESMTDLS